MRIDFSVGTGRGESINEAAGIANAAEESGFSHITYLDVPNGARDVYAMMTVAALSTRRIRIGHGVTAPLVRHPSVTANATATIDELSGGRAFIGIGMGGGSHRSMGIKQPPVRALRAEVEFFKSYMAGEEAEFNGARMHSEWVRRPVPVYVASSHGVRTCELAGELADGVILVEARPELIKWRLGLVEKAAAKAGRDPSKVDVWARTEIILAEIKEEAAKEAVEHAAGAARGRYAFLSKNTPESLELGRLIERLEPGIIDEFKRIHDNWGAFQREGLKSGLVSQRVIDFFQLAGREDDICERIDALGKAGVKNISTMVFTFEDKIGAMREIGDRIMPHFRN